MTIPMLVLTKCYGVEYQGTMGLHQRHSLGTHLLENPLPNELRRLSGDSLGLILLENPCQTNSGDSLGTYWDLIS